MGHSDSSDSLGATRTSIFKAHNSIGLPSSSQLNVNASVRKIQKPWRRRPHLASSATAGNGRYVAHSRTDDAEPPLSRMLPPLPPELTTSGGRGSAEEMGGGSKPRQRQRWIETPVEGAKLNLTRLEKIRLLPPTPVGAFKTRLRRVGSMGTWTKGVGGVSTQLARTARPLENVEACLRSLDNSVRELQFGETSRSANLLG